MDPLDPLAPSSPTRRRPVHRDVPPVRRYASGAIKASGQGALTAQRVPVGQKGKNFPFVAWVAIGTGTVFLVLALPSAALGAFVVGACCAYTGLRTRR